MPAAVISFEPPTLALPPAGQLVVRATVAVTDDFVDGRVYATARHVRDLPAPPLPVELRVGPGKSIRRLIHIGMSVYLSAGGVG